MIVVDGSADFAARVAVSVLERSVFPPSWRKSDGGYDFSFYGNESDGSTGRVSFKACSTPNKTQVRLTLEIHQTKGNRLDEVVNRLGLARQAKRIIRAITGLTRREANVPKTLKV